VRGREWTNANNQVLYFTSLQGWRVREYREEVAVEAQSRDREDDLPF